MVTCWRVLVYIYIHTKVPQFTSELNVNQAPSVHDEDLVQRKFLTNALLYPLIAAATLFEDISGIFAYGASNGFAFTRKGG